MKQERCYIDTNVIVRYLLGDSPDWHRRAVEIIESENPLLVSEMVLIETAYVLESHYQVQRAELVDALIALVLRKNLVMTTLSTAETVEALQLCRPSRRYSFVDAFLWAVAKRRPPAVIYTYDSRFPSYGIRVEG